MTFYKVVWFACVVGVFKLRIQERPYFHFKSTKNISASGGLCPPDPPLGTLILFLASAVLLITSLQFLFKAYCSS